jgi:excisionase family DNA binding protein
MVTKGAIFPELLTVQEAADLLKLKPYTMREKIRDGRVPSVKFAGRTYVLKDELIKQLEIAKRGGKTK